MISLFCLLQGKPITSVFKVELDEGSSISHLKKLLKEELKSSLEGVDASQLNIYPISIPKGDLNALEEVSCRLDQREQIQLDPMDVVGEHFPEPPPKTVHAIIKDPGKSPAGTLGSILLLDRSPLPSAHVVMDANLFFVHSPTYGEAPAY
jgi:hypothetical protein